MLHEFVTANRAEIIARCRAKISSRPAPRATDVELEHGVPLFLDQLTGALQRVLGMGVDAEISTSGTRHGNELLLRGFTVAQVVHDYGGICQTITQLCQEKAAAITTTEVQTLYLCLDQAIAGAVTEYGRLREHEGTERLGRLAHDLRNQLNSALLSFEMLKGGDLGLGSSTGRVLGRSLNGLRNLIDRELAEVRLGAGIYDLETVLVCELLEDVEVAAAMEANAFGHTFSIVGVRREVAVHVDRAILQAVVANLLQNAFKFTRPKSNVVLTTRATSDRVLIEIEDQCGGLPPGKAGELFRPIDPRSSDRKRTGLGLEICARGMMVNGGTIHVRDNPGHGCVFVVDLPRPRSA